MLVLSRRKDERIVIGGSIVITVIDIKGDKVRLGIEAPKEVTVHRHEVHQAIVQEQQAADEERIPPPVADPAPVPKSEEPLPQGS